jgi:hypothetical protein
MDPIPTFLEQAGFGFMAGIFLWLYLGERKDHKDTRKELSAMQEARRLDAVETRTDVTSILPGISQALANISDKIEISKARKR